MGAGVVTTPKPFNAFQLSTKAEVPSFGLSRVFSKTNTKENFISTSWVFEVPAQQKGGVLIQMSSS